MNKTNSELKGIMPALITPYSEDGKVSESVTRTLVRHLISRGSDGFYACGSSGEAFLQTMEERKLFLEIVLDEVKGEVPVIAHVGAMDTATCIDLAQHAAQAGAQAVSAVAPFYYKHRLEQIKEHFIDIANNTDIPLIIYHFPDLTGVSPSPDFYKELSRVEGIIGVKFTSTNMYEMQQIIDYCGAGFRVFNGYDENIIAGLAMGACGAIGSTYNFMPGKFIELNRLMAEGKVEQARAIQYEVNEVIREMVKYNFIAFIREILLLQGFDTGKPRKPIQQLTDQQKSEIHKTVRKYSFLGIS